MPAADVQQLVTDLFDGLNDATACTNYYADVMFLMSLDPDGTMVNAQTQDPTVGISLDLPVASVVTLAVLYDRRHLSKTGIQGATQWDTRWQTTTGYPMAWLEQNQPRHNIALIPLPTQTPTQVLPVSPSSTDPGLNGMTTIYTETRADVHLDEELAMALEIAAREFARDSDHTDHTASQTCRTISGVIFKMLALSLTDNVPASAKDTAQGAASGTG